MTSWSVISAPGPDRGWLARRILNRRESDGFGAGRLDLRSRWLYLGAMASRSLNKVMLIGHLGKDAETRYTQSGAAVTNFSLATSRQSKDQQTGEWKEETEWHNVVVWRAENITNYLLKGRQVYVEGRLQTRSWEDQNGNKRYQTEVVADSRSIILLSGRGGGESAGPPDDVQEAAPRQRQAAAGSSAPNSGPNDPGDQGITDDDVPF